MVISLSLNDIKIGAWKYLWYKSWGN